MNSTFKQSKKKFLLKYIYLFLFAIPLLPVVRSGNALLIYFPQIVLGVIAVYIIVNNKSIIPDYIFFFWVLGVVLYLFGVVTYQGGIFSSLSLGLRLLFPAIFLTIGFGCQDVLIERKFILMLIILLFIELLLSILPSVSMNIRNLIAILYREDSEAFLYGFQYSTTKRAIGSIGNPNLLCLFSVLIFSIVFFRAEYVYTNKSKIIKVISAIVTTVICIETQSREGIVVFLVVIFLYLYFNTNKKKTMLISIPFDVLIVYFIFRFLSGNINRTIDFQSMSGRIDIWNNIIDKTINNSVFNMIFGIGYQNARLVSFFDNIFLKYYVSGGLIGICGFVFCVLLLIKRCIEKKSNISFVLIVVWLVSSFACEFQETFKISIIAFFAISYYLSWNKQIISSSE